SQLKHLIQLTEYVTGMNARIGYPNEHLSGEHTEELAKPMYSTCIGLILKGYNDYENKNKSFEKEYSKITVEEEEQQENGAELESVAMDAADEIPVKKRKGLKKFMDSFKNNLIEMFKEEGDAQL
ncbi:MAG: cell division protein FtsA, partial [Chitinophagaceae bacterium]|nr:cell division protein FtsA [Chitinophagaceae bacterium]